jgi:hypothetical protein
MFGDSALQDFFHWMLKHGELSHYLAISAQGIQLCTHNCYGVLLAILIQYLPVHNRNREVFKVQAFRIDFCM